MHRSFGSSRPASVGATRGLPLQAGVGWQPVAVPNGPPLTQFVHRVIVIAGEA